MQKEFKIQTFLSNVLYLVKTNGLKINHFENEIGVSRGFFYRVLRSSDNPGINVKTVIAVSEYFGISIEALLYKKLGNIDFESLWLDSVFTDKEHKTFRKTNDTEAVNTETQEAATFEPDEKVSFICRARKDTDKK